MEIQANMPSNLDTTEIAAQTLAANLQKVSNSSLDQSTSSNLQELLSTLDQPLSRLEIILSTLRKLLAALGALSESSEEKTIADTPQNTNPVATEKACEEVKNTKTPGDMQFADFVRGRLTADANGKVSEAEMQYAMVSYQLHQEDTKAESFFQGKYQSAKKLGANTETAVRLALKDTYQEGFIPKEAAEWVNGLTRVTAQFDSSEELATTKASGMLDLESAIVYGNANLANLVLGKITASPEALEKSSNSKKTNTSTSAATTKPSTDSAPIISGAQARGFLWKPVSESDRNLVVLLPQRLTGLVDSAGIFQDTSGTKPIEIGRFAGDSHNGGRSHFRFSKQGASYPNDIFLVVELKDGGKEAYRVNNSSSRIEG